MFNSNYATPFIKIESIHELAIALRLQPFYSLTGKSNSLISKGIPLVDTNTKLEKRLLKNLSSSPQSAGSMSIKPQVQVFNFVMELPIYRVTNYN